MAGVSRTTLRLALDPVTKPLTFAPPTCQAPTASCAVSVRNKEEWNADKTDTSVCGDDVLGYDVAHCGCLADHLRVIGGQLFRTTLTLGRFASSLSLCLSVSFTLSLFFSLFVCVGGTLGNTVSTQDVLTSTAPALPALGDYCLHPRHTLPTGPRTQCPTTQSWFAFHTAALRTFRLTLAPLSRCTHCHFMVQARALRVPVLCDDHTLQGSYLCTTVTCGIGNDSSRGE